MFFCRSNFKIQPNLNIKIETNFKLEVLKKVKVLKFDLESSLLLSIIFIPKIYLNFMKLCNKLRVMK
jgi:hypothetical protein